MNKAIKSVFLVLGIGILSLIPESLSAVEWSATWTGAENGFWTNANNWVDGQIGGRWLVKDAGGHVVTNGALGCTVYPSRANFLMFTPPHGIEANGVYVGLLKKGVIVRALKSYEMPWNIRVSVGSPRENKLFLDGMRELLGKEA